MGVIKGLFIGVDKNDLGAPNLYNCANDVRMLSMAFRNKLNLAFNQIECLGLNGKVTTNELKLTLSKLLPTFNEEDSFIFYFSGHGRINYTGSLEILLSDSYLGIDQILILLQLPKIAQLKNVFVILDCCFSGKLKLPENKIMFDEKPLSSLCTKGYALMASSRAYEESLAGSIDRPLSLFTSFLVDALSAKFLVRKGRLSLNEIQRYIRLRANVWNSKHSSHEQQHPIYKTEIIGDISFKVEEYFPYEQLGFYYKSDEFIIMNVEPTHSGIAKRYSVQVILCKLLNDEELATVIF